MILDVLLEIESAVNTNLAAAFDVEDAEYAAREVTRFGAAATLDNIATIRFEEMPSLPLQNYPALLLLPRGGDESTIQTAQTFLRHQIDCVIVMADTRESRLAWQLYKAHEALRRVLAQYVEGDGVDENPVFRVDLAGWAYTPLLEIEGGGLEQAVIQSIVCHEIEARP